MKRILTGDRPTGRLHLGHYVGSIANRVALQDRYECFFVVADLHTLTTRPEREHTEALGATVREMVLDELAVGIDPARSTVYLQSAVPEVCELAILLGNLVTVPRLERVPSLKDRARPHGDREDGTHLTTAPTAIRSPAEAGTRSTTLHPLASQTRPSVCT